jgi:[acyl-carrier-protein] S-malonyltransferase
MIAQPYALLFPGQGSQQIGMGQAFAQKFPIAADLYAQADQILESSFSQMCWSGDIEILNQTYNTQPALYVAGLAALAAAQAAGLHVQPEALAGHSLGEITALAAADALSFADGLRLVRERARLMRLAGELAPGGMTAILQLDFASVAEICATAQATTNQPVQIANDNCPGQLVISGHRDALACAEALATAAGARKVVRLAVSIAAHSPLMATVASEYADFVNSLPIQMPNKPVISNVTARPLSSVAEIQTELVAQLTATVCWTASMQYLLDRGMQHFVELGCKDVLKGLLRRIDKSANVYVVEDPVQLQAWLAA